MEVPRDSSPPPRPELRRSPEMTRVCSPRMVHPSGDLRRCRDAGCDQAQDWLDNSLSRPSLWLFRAACLWPCSPKSWGSRRLEDGHAPGQLDRWRAPTAHGPPAFGRRDDRLPPQFNFRSRNRETRGDQFWRAEVAHFSRASKDQRLVRLSTITLVRLQSDRHFHVGCGRLPDEGCSLGRLTPIEVHPRLVVIVPPTPQFDVPDRGLATHLVRPDVMELDERALAAATTVPRKCPPDIGRDVARSGRRLAGRPALGAAAVRK